MGEETQKSHLQWLRLTPGRYGSNAQGFYLTLSEPRRFYENKNNDLHFLWAFNEFNTSWTFHKYLNLPQHPFFKTLTNVAVIANERDIIHDDAEMLYNRLKSIKGINTKLDVTPKAMHNNFAWSSYFTGFDLLKLGDQQCELFAKRISHMLNNHDEL